MSGEPAIIAVPSRRPPLWQLVATFLVFVIVGPPIGAIAGTLFLTALSAGGNVIENAKMIGESAIDSTYPIGLPPAAVAGLLVAARDFFRRTNLPEALIVGLLCGGVWGVFFGVNFLGLAIIVASVVAAAGCWRITRWRPVTA